MVEHDQALCDNLAAVVKPEDIVWFLGDISIEGMWKYALERIAALPGRKRLIWGNHDQGWPGKSEAHKYFKAYTEVFEVVSPWMRTKVNGHPVLLSHFPYVGDHTRESRFDQFRLKENSTTLLHGHTHKREIKTVTSNGYVQIHVGVDAHDFKPVPAHDVLSFINRPGQF